MSKREQILYLVEKLNNVHNVPVLETMWTPGEKTLVCLYLNDYPLFSENLSVDSAYTFLLGLSNCLDYLDDTELEERIEQND